MQHFTVYNVVINNKGVLHEKSIFISFADSSGSNSTAPNTSMEDDCRVSNKRKPCTSLGSPSKRLRKASESTEVEVEAVMAKGTKRKSSTQRESPKKKPRGHSNDSESTEVRVEDVMTRGTKRKASPDGDSPSKMKRDFEAKYQELDKLGEGGYGSVFSGVRKTDNFPSRVKFQPKVLKGEIYMVPTEVLLMLRVAGGPKSQQSAAVSLLDWFDLDEEVLLVMERPVPCMDLYTYLDGPQEEEQAKVLKLVEAFLCGVFHRDIKSENILIKTDSDTPQVHIIDFGCGCFVNDAPYRNYCGTAAFAPPEFFLKGTYKAGPTTVWQLGALLYELVDGCNLEIELLEIPVTSRLMLALFCLFSDCRDLLKMCLEVNPDERVTLQQMQQHPWFA
uniref:Serine/threonine-protein kinase n=1 Tax=Dicentrarchus labrax TaxID=13489 RepID=A0A8C4HS12_DICLA